ncbi:MAG TPA: SIMPL domain-containing protein [Gemmatimonadales bacterium]|nr:SIMPL domain-containing protein [Gemmatimonadales bacterium]
MNDRPIPTPALVPAVLVMVGLLGAAALISGGIQRFRLADRYVTVKGVAERDITADVGIWPLRFTSADNDLDRARRGIEADRHRVMAFFARHGIDSTQVELQGLEVTDNQANPYRPGGQDVSRFILTMTLVARSRDPQRIAVASQAVGELVAGGVVLSSGPFGGGPTYLFTRLNALKPQMLAEATRNARQAAAEFARESGAHVGSIRRATQGVFEILPRDQAPGINEGNQIQKTLRVVATMDYDLK